MCLHREPVESLGVGELPQLAHLAERTTHVTDVDPELHVFPPQTCAIGTIGTTTRDSRPRSWNTVLSATTRRRSRPMASPVFGFTSNRGKLELDTSRRIRCPGMNRLLVG